MAETYEGTPLFNHGPETASLGKSTAEQLAEARERMNREAPPVELTDDEGTPLLTIPRERDDLPELVVPEWGEEPDEAEPEAAPEPQGSEMERRLAAAAERAGFTTEDYLRAVEALSEAPPAPELSVEDEVATRLGADPNYVALYQAAQDPANFSTDMERMLAVQLLTTQTNQTRAAIQTERGMRQTAETTAAAVAREQIDILAGKAQFAPFLKTREDREALRKYQKVSGIPDMETAAKSFLFDKAFQAGRTTQARARKASVDRGRASDGSLPTSRPGPGAQSANEAAAKQGLWAFTQHIRGRKAK